MIVLSKHNMEALKTEIKMLGYITRGLRSNDEIEEINIYNELLINPHKALLYIKHPIYDVQYVCSRIIEGIDI